MKSYPPSSPGFIMTSMGSRSHGMSGIKEIVAVRSKKKKNDHLYSSFTMDASVNLEPTKLW